jgi:hypothetical protein
VRPAPIGIVVAANGIPKPHTIRAYYLGWTGNGHIKRVNVSHAFYQVLGTDDFNPIAGRPVDLNGRMGALELSVDKNWLRFRGSVFYASGDGSSRIGATRSSTARGFDSIVDDTHFAGTAFSFFDTEGIRHLAVNPPDEVVLSKDSVIIAIGDVSDLRRARADANPADKTSG